MSFEGVQNPSKLNTVEVSKTEKRNTSRLLCEKYRYKE